MGPRFKKAMFVEYYSNLFMFETRQPDPRDETLHGPQLAANVGDRITIGIAFSIAEHCFFFFFLFSSDFLLWSFRFIHVNALIKINDIIDQIEESINSINARIIFFKREQL